MMACHLIDTDNRKRNLTVDEQEKIKDLLSQGMPIKTIAKEINISFYKVSEFINEAGIILSCDTMTKGCDDALAEEWEVVTNDLLNRKAHVKIIKRQPRIIKRPPHGYIW